MLQLFLCLVIHILSDYVGSRGQAHLFLYIHPHATQHVKQELPMNALEACD